MSTTRVVVPDGPSLARTVAAELLTVLAAAQADGRVPQIGLTGGSIAEALHRELAHQADGSGVDWSRVVIWWGDERFVPADSPDRNAGQARAAWLDHVPLDPAHVHEVPASDQVHDVETAAQAYAATLRAHGAGEFEVLMLGVGPDGHVASLFPGFPQLDVDDQIAVAVTGSPKPPPERVSLTFPTLNRSRRVWFLVSGAEKAPAVARAHHADASHIAAEESHLGGEESDLAGEGSDLGGEEPLPAMRVQGREQTVWYVDRAAGSLLGDQPEFS